MRAVLLWEAMWVSPTPGREVRGALAPSPRFIGAMLKAIDSVASGFVDLREDGLDVDPGVGSVAALADR